MRTQKTREEVKKLIQDDVDLAVDSIQELLEICCPKTCGMCYYSNLCINESIPKEEEDGQTKPD